MGGNCCTTSDNHQVSNQDPNSQDGGSISQLTKKGLETEGSLGVTRSRFPKLSAYERDSNSLERTSEPVIRTPQSVSGSMASMGQLAGQLTKITSISLVTAMNPVAPNVENLLEKYPTPKDLSGLPEMPDEYDPSLPESGPWLVHPYKATYFGQTENDLPHGYGRLVTSKGAVMEGYFKEGELTGYARIFEQSGQSYIGGFKNKRKHGQGTFIDKRGQVINAQWEQGVTNGPVEVFDAVGRLIFKGTTVLGKRSGFGVEWNPYERYRYEGDFENDKFHGKGSKIYDDGRAYTGGFKHGLEHGDGLLVKVDGRILKGKFEYGYPRGEIVLINENQEEKKVRY